MMARCFDLVGVDASDVAERKLDGFRRWALTLLAFEAVVAFGYTAYRPLAPAAAGAVVMAFFACLGLGWHRRYARWAIALVGLLELGLLAVAFPDNANHQFLAVVLLALLFLVGDGTGEAKGRPARADAVVCLQAIRWIVLGGFFWAGMAKLVSGYWFEGAFLTWRVATDPGFASVFAWLIPEDELARLAGLGRGPGAGPFRVDAPGLIVVSNLTWLAELVLPLGLLIPSTRRWALFASLALLAAIQVGAREFFFAGWMLAGFLLFLERDRLSPLLPIVWVCLCLYVGWTV